MIFFFHILPLNCVCTFNKFIESFETFYRKNLKIQGAAENLTGFKSRYIGNLVG